MFNKNDDLISLISSVDRPKDHFKGLPDLPLGGPRNLILFSSNSSLHHGSPAQHHRFVLISNFKTRGSVIVDDTVIQLAPGQGVLVLPYQFHHYADFHSKEICWLWTTFEHSHPEHLLSLRGKKLQFTPFHQDSIGEMIRFYKEENSEALAGLLTTLLSDWMGGKDKLRGKDDDVANPLIQEIASLVYEGLLGDLSVTALASKVHLSPSHLRAKFKKLTGIGLGTYVRQTRIHRACVMLSQTEDSVSEVAEATGFDSLYAFSRTFRQIKGNSPTEWRKRMQMIEK